MPKVKLVNAAGTTQTASGGCFGFTGRNGSISNYYSRIALELPQHDITNYIYYIGEQYGDGNQQGLNNPTNYIKWICDGSSWAKYINGYTIGDTLNIRRSVVDIKTDIPGHCVIGSASAIRLASHRKEHLIPFWNMATLQGCDPAISLLVFYALFKQTVIDFNITDGKYISSITANLTHRLPSLGSSGKLSLGDDEVMTLNRVHPGLIYSFIRGDFEMARDDFNNEQIYSKGTGYQQQILNSFNSTSAILGSGPEALKSFPDFLLRRFNTILPKASLQRQESSGMGYRAQEQKSAKTPVYLSELIGWAKVLTNEFKCYGRFLGWEGR